MSKKLDVNEARVQVLALMAHEFSHLVGFNEDEAEALQKIALTAFLSRRADELQNRVQQRLRNLWEAQESVAVDAQQSFTNLYFDSQGISKALAYVMGDPDTALKPSSMAEPYFSLLRWKDIGVENELFWRMAWFNQAQSNKPYMDVLFGQATRISLGDAYKNVNIDGGALGLPYPNSDVVTRVTDGPSAQIEMQAISSILSNFYNAVVANVIH